MLRIIRQVFVISLLLLSVPVWATANTIYVRLNADPFAAPHYLFSLAEDGEPIRSAFNEVSSCQDIQAWDGWLLRAPAAAAE